MDPQSFMLSEIIQRKTNTYDFTYMWNLKEKMSRQTRNKPLETENKLMVAKGEGGG